MTDAPRLGTYDVDFCPKCRAIVIVWDLPEHLLWHESITRNKHTIIKESPKGQLVLR